MQGLAILTVLIITYGFLKVFEYGINNIHIIANILGYTVYYGSMILLIITIIAFNICVIIYFKEKYQ